MHLAVKAFQQKLYTPVENLRDMSLILNGSAKDAAKPFVNAEYQVLQWDEPEPDNDDDDEPEDTCVRCGQSLDWCDCHGSDCDCTDCREARGEHDPDCDCSDCNPEPDDDDDLDD
jgi:hypothetical protein